MLVQLTKKSRKLIIYCTHVSLLRADSLIRVLDFLLAQKQTIDMLHLAVLEKHYEQHNNRPQILFVVAMYAVWCDLVLHGNAHGLERNRKVMALPGCTIWDYRLQRGDH